jgi:hypothetical protein
MKIIVSLTLVLSLGASVWSQTSRYDPAHRDPAKEHSSFIDFALKQVNPGNNDYGCQIDEMRKAALDSTIRTFDWWTTVVACGLLLLTLVVIVHQHRLGRRRVQISARFAAQLTNALHHAQRELEIVTSKHNELAESARRAAETSTKTRPADGDTRGAKAQLATARTVILAAKERDNSVGASGPAVQPTDPQPGESNVNYPAQLRAMQQRLLALQQDIEAGRKREDAGRERERNLQRELDKLRHNPASGQGAESRP